ncbi:uncharacterized protein LOC128617975 [Ictalurus furcatus]|uniref:uncharacterized protein LOC128617975 n=1 Tax=Ictalurus furcatus TaxID=66913 RepID=UPI00234FF67D|nr:uncharacterized protein LOC128617975 [Ictalurus furcatus]
MRLFGSKKTGSEALSYSTMESITVMLTLWFIWICLWRDDTRPSCMPNRFIAYAAQRFSLDRACRIRRFLQRQLMPREEFAASLADYHSHSSVRSIWVRQRCGVWWEHVFTSWTDFEWMLHFRMRETTFLQPCNLLWPHLQRETTTFRKPVPVEQCIAICMWRLALNVEFGTIPHLFGIGQSTAVTIGNHVASVIVNNLFSLYIRTPSEQEIKVIIQGFQDQWGFRQCGGAIDGTHIGILAPRDSPADYYSCKGFYSVILQGVVDHCLRFWNINVGWPGKVHDARVFGNSSLYKRSQRGTLFLNLRGLQE